MESGLIKTTSLGKEIIWKERIIGRVFDFNGNGKEELYLYYLSGMNRSPRFIEFNGIEFVEILDIGIVNAFIAGADPERKIINIRIEYSTNDSPVLTVDNNLYKWDSDTFQYDLINREIQKFRWD